MEPTAGRPMTYAGRKTPRVTQEAIVTKLMERYRRLSPWQQKASIVAVVAGVLFDAFVIRDIIRSDSTRLLPKVGWIAATLLSTPSGGLSYLRFGRR